MYKIIYIHRLLWGGSIELKARPKLAHLMCIEERQAGALWSLIRQSRFSNFRALFNERWTLNVERRPWLWLWPKTSHVLSVWALDVAFDDTTSVRVRVCMCVCVRVGLSSARQAPELLRQETLDNSAHKHSLTASLGTQLKMKMSFGAQRGTKILPCKCIHIKQISIQMECTTQNTKYKMCMYIYVKCCCCQGCSPTQGFGPKAAQIKNFIYTLCT